MHEWFDTKFTSGVVIECLFWAVFNAIYQALCVLEPKHISICHRMGIVRKKTNESLAPWHVIYKLTGSNTLSVRLSYLLHCCGWCVWHPHSEFSTRNFAALLYPFCTWFDLSVLVYTFTLLFLFKLWFIIPCLYQTCSFISRRKPSKWSLAWFCFPHHHDFNLLLLISQMDRTWTPKSFCRLASKYDLSHSFIYSYFIIITSCTS